MRMLSFVVACTILASSAAGQSDVERFDLLHECAPMRLVVERLPNAAASINLTSERVQSMAESRLRAARLYDDEALEHRLYVRVGVGRSGAFSIEVSYWKELHDPVSDLWSLARTWDSSGYGTHGDDAGYIMSGLSEHLDRFILEYLRVNEAAC